MALAQGSSHSTYIQVTYRDTGIEFGPFVALGLGMQLASALRAVLLLLERMPSI